MQPFFFGPMDRRLFGVYHAPEAAKKDCGVVLCQALAHEYYNSHRETVRLARALARSGLAVLRFDYYGTGESAGEYEEASVAQWLGDIGVACEELRSRGCRRLCLAGLRFGATLAALFCAERNAADALVLWEPVADGADYLREVIDLHRGVLATLPTQGDYGEREFLGFEYSDALHREIAAVDLRARCHGLRCDVLLMESAVGSLRPALEAATHVDYESTPESPFWLGRLRPTMPNSVPPRMASWISSACC